MFRYSFLIDSLLKAMTHKYIRRVPKGVTKTGKTTYMYYYAGQEGHGKGIGHENKSIEPLLTDMYDKNKTQKTIQFTEDFRDKLASLKDFTNAQVIFAQSATDKTQFDVYHRFGESDGRQKVKIGEVALGQGGIILLMNLRYAWIN